MFLLALRQTSERILAINMKKICKFNGNFKRKNEGKTCVRYEISSISTLNHYGIQSVSSVIKDLIHLMSCMQIQEINQRMLSFMASLKVTGHNCFLPPTASFLSAKYVQHYISSSGTPSFRTSEDSST